MPLTVCQLRTARVAAAAAAAGTVGGEINFVRREKNGEMDVIEIKFFIRRKTRRVAVQMIV